MKNINLNKLIEERNLNTSDIADLLFPENKYPGLALQRVLKGESHLNAVQISRLSLYTGIPIAELFEGGEWKAKNSEGVFIFTKRDYKAILDPSSGVTKVFHNGSLFHESILHSSTIPLSEFLIELNTLIQNFDKK